MLPIKFKYQALLAVIVKQVLPVHCWSQQCKATPSSHDWPRAAQWSALNRTVSGRLLQPPPPGAVCHAGHPTFNNAACPDLQAAWLTEEFHAGNPVSVAWENFNNDTCLPYATDLCSGEGYPIYVINATCAEDVKAGVDFARENNVRLVVKSSGHDYIGRTSAPFALSIWTHHMNSLKFHKTSFQPTGCHFSIDTPALTAGAGANMGAIAPAASALNLTVPCGGALTVSLGGYLTGGGHSAFSSIWGLSADGVYEMEIVTPGGEILTINECQNQDLFWAMRGGGGSTFGVMISATMRARPAPELLTATVVIGTSVGSPNYWPVIADIISHLAAINALGIGGYITTNPLFPHGNNTYAALFGGIFLLPVTSSANTTASLIAPFTDLIATVTTRYPAGEFFTSITPVSYVDFWAYFQSNNGPDNAGTDQILGSRLLDVASLSNKTAVQTAFQALGENGALAVHMVAGPGVWNAEPRGGSDAVNPAWRKCLLHTVAGTSIQPLNLTARKEAEGLMRAVVEVMRELDPDSGAYVNEAAYNELDFQQSFWGGNYPRLLEIKRKVDPGDVLWCNPCVGNERWAQQEDGSLCRV